MRHVKHLASIHVDYEQEADAESHVRHDIDRLLDATFSSARLNLRCTLQTSSFRHTDSTHLHLALNLIITPFFTIDIIRPILDLSAL